MAVLIVIGSALLTGNLGRPVLYQFSPDYKGWVVVAYDKPGCSPLSKDGVYLVVSIPFSGRACTSSPVPEGWRYYRFECVYENGRRRVLRDKGWNNNSEIWPISYNPKRKIEFLFVGSQQELHKSWASRPDRLRPDK